MANIATHLRPTLKSTYNLWKILSETSDTVVCYYFDLPYREYDEDRQRPKEYATAPSSSKKTEAKAIADWIGSNVRSFTYTELTTSDYDPNWTSVDDLECVHKASLATGGGVFDKVSLPHVEEDLDTYHTQVRAIIAKVMTTKYSSAPFTIDYPLMTGDLGTVDAVSNLPAGLLALVTDSRKSGYSTMLGSSSRGDIITLEKTFRDGTSDYANFDDSGEWFVDSHPNLGSFEGDYPLLKTHPQYTYLTV